MSLPGMLRRRAEGLLFFGVILALLPALMAFAVCGFVRDPAACAAGLRRIAARWGRFLLRGLAPVREVWWTLFQFEPASSLWRHVLLLEVFELSALSARRRAAAAGIDPTARVLVVNLAHIGDLLHTMPLVRSLRRQRPEATIDLLVGPWCAELARRIPGVGSVLVYRPGLLAMQRDSTPRVCDIWRDIRQLASWRRRDYDVILSASNTRIPDLVLWSALRPRLWIGVESAARSLYTLGPAACARYDSRVYEAARVNALLSLAGLEPGDPTLSFPVSPQELEFADQRLGPDSTSEPARPIAVLAPGGGWPGKCWPPDRFAAVGRWLALDKGFRVCLVGSRAERSLCEEVLRAMHAPADNLAGETTLPELAAVLTRARLFVGNDSGPLHFAVATGIPAVALFGPTRPAQWMPGRGCQVALQSDYPCEGCIPWHVRAQCLHDRECMKRISVEQVQGAIQSLLTTESPQTTGTIR